MDAFDAGYALQDMTVAQVLEALIDGRPELKMSETAFWKHIGVSDGMREIAQYASRTCKLLATLQETAAHHEPALLRLASVLAAPVALYRRIAEMANIPVEPSPEHPAGSLSDQFQAIERAYAEAGLYTIAFAWQQIRSMEPWQDPNREQEVVRKLQVVYSHDLRKAATQAA